MCTWTLPSLFICGFGAFSVRNEEPQSVLRWRIEESGLRKKVLGCRDWSRGPRGVEARRFTI